MPFVIIVDRWSNDFKPYSMNLTETKPLSCIERVNKNYLSREKKDG